MNRFQQLFEIFIVSLRLGLTSFGGPVAHLGFFKNEYVDRKKWLNEQTYADLVALCQFLPGPASSQVGMAVGLVRGGVLGSIVSFLGFTMPSVIALVFFAQLYTQFDLDTATWIQSLKIIAVAVVAHALIGMGRKLTPDRPRIALALVSAVLLLLAPSTLMQIGIIIVAGLIGYFGFGKVQTEPIEQIKISVTKRKGVAALVTLGVLLISLPIATHLFDHVYVQLFDIFFRIGSIVFGGGHVVLPLMEQALVPIGFVTDSEFLAGYGMAQAVPGPLFTFASFLGMASFALPGAIIATIGIFLPSFLLVIGTLPFLTELRNGARFQGILAGVNASVVGILLAAFYNPVFTSGVSGGIDFGLVVILFALLQFWRLPAWLIVIIGIVLGEIIALFT